MSGWLAGRRVLVTRAEDQAEGLSDRLREMGAEPVEFPVIAIVPPEPGGPLDAAIARLAEYDWVIFTSVNGVEQFWARAEESGRLPDAGGERPGARGQGPVETQDFASLRVGCRVAAIGPATAEALRERGVRVTLVPGEYRAEAILDEIGDVAGKRILLPRADIARQTLAEGLRARGAQVDAVDAYRTLPAAPPEAAFDVLRAGVDVITFTSSSTVRNFVRLTAGVDYGRPTIACIGPITAGTARELGLPVDVVAREYTMDGLVEALDGLPSGRPTFPKA